VGIISESDGKIDKLLGLGGGILSFILLAICGACLIYGIYPMHHSLTMTGEAPEWNVTKPVIGIILSLIGLVMSGVSLHIAILKGKSGKIF